jgi:hypothetical protein
VGDCLEGDRAYLDRRGAFMSKYGKELDTLTEFTILQLTQFVTVDRSADLTKCTFSFLTQSHHGQGTRHVYCFNFSNFNDFCRKEATLEIFGFIPRELIFCYLSSHSYVVVDT